LGLIEEMINFITNGSIAGLPSWAVMFVPFIIGLIVGFLAINFLKIALLAIVVLAVAIYFGFYSISIPALETMAQQYGSSARYLGSFIIGVLPLGTGFFIGAIVGFVLG
jgi:uncharacterized membrane protein (Fun14 family)